MENKKIDEKTLKEIMDSISDSFDKKYVESPIFKYLVENSEYLSDPDEMHTMIIYPFERCVALAIEKTQKTSEDALSLWMDYPFLENNVSELCSHFYGGSCCVDRGRFLVKSYIKFKETGVMPEFNWKQEYTFHYPEKGTIQQWFDFIEGVSRLKYGYNKEYLLALKILMEVHSQKLNKKKKKSKINLNFPISKDDLLFGSEGEKEK